MRDYLVFRLYGPLAAWGAIAVGQERPSDVQPSKSAILGLLAAALGVRRTEEETLSVMADAYGFAARMDAPGRLLRDYHTAQVPSRADLKKRPAFTRRDELQVARERQNTILSSREYRCDALYTVALWCRNDTAPYTLAALQAALERPRFTLYLGRKSCPLALPVQAQCLAAADLPGAFDGAQFADAEFLSDRRTGQPLLGSGEADYYWDEDAEAGALTQGELTLVFTRRDQLSSRRRWQFSERREHHGRMIRTPDDRQGG